MYGGLKVIIENHWPRECIGHEVYSYPGHPFWQWLRRTFGVGYGVSMERGRPLMRDKDPMIYMGHTLICSPRHLQQIKALCK